MVRDFLYFLPLRQALLIACCRLVRINFLRVLWPDLRTSLLKVMVFFLLSVASIEVNAQVAIDEMNFPDSIFRQYVLDIIDKNHDAVLSSTEANAIGSLPLKNTLAQSLEGIKFFPNLRYLDCEYSQVTSLDVTQNLIMKDLNCSSSKITSLDVTSCTQLQKLECSSNQLTSLDVTQNLQLQVLSCAYNQLTVLDLTKNTQLQKLFCIYNQLTVLDLRSNPLLQSLDCSHNQLTSLDVTNCEQLQSLNCYTNQLTSLDVTNCKQLQRLDCYTNQLTSLDVTKCTRLQNLECSINPLSTLDVTQNLQLRAFYCVANQLTSLDVTQNQELQSLFCGVNQLTALDVTKNLQLQTLVCYSNQLESLDVTKNLQLRTLKCFDNQLIELDVTQNAQLEALECYDNSLFSLDCSHLPKLRKLYCSGQQWLTSVEPAEIDGVNAFRIVFPANSHIYASKSLVVINGQRFDKYYFTKTEATSISPSSLVSIDFYNANSQIYNASQPDINNLYPWNPDENYFHYTYEVPLFPNVSVYGSTSMDVKIVLEPFFATYLQSAAKMNNGNAGELTNKYIGTLYLDVYAENPYAEYPNSQVFFPNSLDSVGENGGWAIRHVLVSENQYIPANKGFLVANDKPGYVIFRAPYVYEKSRRAIITSTPRTTLRDYWPSPPILDGTTNIRGIRVPYGSVLTLGRRRDDGSNTLGFWNFSGEWIKPYRAYIPADKIPSAATSNTRFQGFELRFENEFGDEIILDDTAITGINTAEMNTTQMSSVFDLQGRRVANPQKGGVYIVNGKKVLMK